MRIKKYEVLGKEGGTERRKEGHKKNKEKQKKRMRRENGGKKGAEGRMEEIRR